MAGEGGIKGGGRGMLGSEGKKRRRRRAEEEAEREKEESEGGERSGGWVRRDFRGRRKVKGEE